MSLRGVKVGDVVITTDVNRMGHRREAVTSIGRKYITVGRRRYDIETGVSTGPWASHYHAYTIARWGRRESESALLTAANKIGDLCRRVGASLSDEEVKSIAATLQDIAAKLEKSSL